MGTAVTLPLLVLPTTLALLARPGGAMILPLRTRPIAGATSAGGGAMMLPLRTLPVGATMLPLRALPGGPAPAATILPLRVLPGGRETP